MLSKALQNYLVQWCHRHRERYEGRPGVTALKLEALVQLLAYGAPQSRRLTEVARCAGVSMGTLRVWRTEAPFQRLYRQMVWECADAFVGDFLQQCPADEPQKAGHQRFLAAQLASFATMGSAVQHAVLWRLVGDGLRLSRTWPPFLDRIDMTGELLDLAMPRPRPFEPITEGGIQTAQSFVWQALERLQTSRANTLAQRQRHFAVRAFLGLLIANAAYQTGSSSARAAGFPFLGATTLEGLEATFVELYARRRKTRRKD